MRKESRLRMLMLTQGAWDHASSRERAVRYRALLEATGRWRVHWLSRVPERPGSNLGKLRFAAAKRFFTAIRAFQVAFGQWDVVFVQRLFLSKWLLDILKQRGIPLVYDFDDAIYLDPSGSRANETSTAAMVGAADEVIVSTEELVPFCEAHGSRPTVITTPVDVDRVTPAEREAGDGTCVIGWIGSPSTTQYLNGIAPALANLTVRYPVRVLAVGADESALHLPGVPLEVVPWSFEREPEFLRQMAIGIMPLPDDVWARGKGGYKLLLYMAAGLPVVASPVGINREIIRYGETGFLAEDTDAWVEHLHFLCRDARARMTLGRAGRKLAETQYSRDVCFEQLLTCLNRVVDEQPRVRYDRH